MKKILLSLSLAWSLSLLLLPGYGQMAAAKTPDGEPPAEETVCDGETGAAFGLCNAFCEAMDCDAANPQASGQACERVEDRFAQVTGRIPPCLISCPCFTAEDLQQGTIAACGENFPGFPNLAGVIYTDGRQGCSGENCAVAGGMLSCALIKIDGTFVIEAPITVEEDLGCRILILENCPTPNLAGPEALQAPGEPLPFIDQ